MERSLTSSGPTFDVRRPPGVLGRHPVLGVVFLALCLRVAWLIYAEPIPVSDFAGYRELAERIADGGRFPPSAYRLPGFPYFLAVLMLAGRSVGWLSLGVVVLSSGLVAIVYVLAVRVTGGDQGAALFAALLCAVSPTFVFFAPVLASEHLFVALLFGGLLVVDRAERHTVVWAAVGGGVLGLAILTRGEGVFYVPAFVLSCALALPQWKKRVICSVVVLVGCSAVVVPWYVRNVVVVGRGAGLSTTGGTNFYHAHNAEKYGWRPLEETELEGLGEVERQRLGYSAGFDSIRKRGARGLWRDVKRGTLELYGHDPYALRWSTRLPRAALGAGYPVKWFPMRSVLASASLWYYVALAVFAAAALVLRVRVGRSWRWFPLASIVVLNWLCYAVVFWAKARYRFAAEVVICMFAGVGAHALVSLAARKLRW